MKQAQITLLTDLALQKAQTAKDLSQVIPPPDKFYVVVDSSVVVPTHYSEQPTLQTYIDNEFGVTIFPTLNDYIHILTSKTQIAGTVSVGAGLKSVVGVGTAFETAFSAGDKISIAAQVIEIDTITDDSNLTLKSHHQYGATDSLAYKVVEEWWRYTSGDGDDPADYTSIAYDPENQAGISSEGLYWPDPENVIADYTASFFDDPGTGLPFEGDLEADDYFQSAVDPKSMHIKIVKTAGTWALGVTVHNLLVVDTDGDLFAIIHSTGSDFASGAEWSLIPEYAFLWASILEGMIVDSVKRTVEADSTIVQIEASYQTVRTIARSMGKNADLVVGTPTQNGLQEADHLIDDWSDDLKQDLTGTVTVGIGTKAVVGTGTAFLTELSVGGFVVIAGELHEVDTITDNDNFALVDNHVAGATDVTAYVEAADTRTRVLFRIGTHAPASDWAEPEKLDFEFDRDAVIDMTGLTHYFADLTGRIVLVNAADDSLVITGSCDGLIVESDNFLCLDMTSATGVVIHNGRTLHGQAATTSMEPVRKYEFDISQPNMVVVPQAQINNYADDPGIVYYDFATKTFKQRSGTGRVPLTGDWTRMYQLETMTDDLEFPASYDDGKIDCDRHNRIDPGDAGGGVPYAIYHRGKNAEIDLLTTVTLDDLLALQAGIMPTSAELKNQQYLKNRGAGNRIRLNGEKIYSGGRPRERHSPIQIIHPYVFPHNGFAFHGVAVGGTNDEETLLIDAWKAWGGIEALEIAPIHNPFASIAFWYKLFMPDDAGYFMRPATHFGGTGGVDPNVHDRTSPNGSETLTSGNYTSSAEAIIKGISDANIKKFKLLSRIQATGLPSSASFTTLISKIVQNAADDNWIYLIDSETGSAVSVTATGDLTIDMGGNSGISLQLDAFQGHSFQYHFKNISVLTGVGTSIDDQANPTPDSININRVKTPISDGVNGTPRTSTQTRPTSKQSYRYTLP